MLVLLLACSPQTSTSTDDSATDVCNESPVVAPLDSWEAPSSLGPSEADGLGFVLGSWALPMVWDDGSTATASLATTPVSAEEDSFGDPERCSTALVGTFDWALSSTDGRIGLQGQEQQQYFVGYGSNHPTSVNVEPTVTQAEVGLEPLDSASTFRFVIQMRADGTALVNIVETWLTDPDTQRQCIRGTTEDQGAVCSDSEVYQGSD